MEKATFLEKASDNVGTGIVATLIAASGGTYLAPLLPTLFGALANGRFQKRVSDALFEIEERLSKQEESVKNVSDEQFKLIGETVSTILRTTNQEKIQILKEAVINGVSVTELEEYEVSIITRVLRDISISELRYLLKIQNVEEIYVMSKGDDEPPKNNKLFVNSSNPNAGLLAGLVNLGLIIPTGSGFGGTINYRVLPITKKLIDLIEVK